MTGESEPLQLPAGAGPQPGGRPPAPGRLRLVQAFINTHFDLVHEHGAEILGSPRALARWLAQAGLMTEGPPLSGADVSRAVAVREGLRRLAASTHGDEGAREGALAQLDAVAVGTRV